MQDTNPIITIPKFRGILQIQLFFHEDSSLELHSIRKRNLLLIISGVDGYCNKNSKL